MIRIPVTIVIEMDDEQEARWREDFALPEPPRARDIVGSVCKFACEVVDRAFAGTDDGAGATVTIKGR